MSGPARILLVDDSVVIRGMLSKFIDAEADLEVVSTAPNGVIGVQKARSLSPDLIVLDVEMPEMDGLTALRQIREFDSETPIVMFSTLTGRGASVTLDALSAGASDYAAKPTTSDGKVDALAQVRDELIVKMRALLGARRPAPRRSVAASSRPALAPRDTPEAPVRLRTSSGPREMRAVVVGSSTGGPVALETFLASMPGPLRVPIFVVQHMPEKFTTALADRLDRKTSHRVVEVEQAMDAEAGHVYIAPGGRHMRIVRRAGSVRVEPFDGPQINSCRPSVDPMFESAGAVYGDRALAVMLTGMGSDGTEGTRALSGHGADVLAQDEETSTVWGMPGSVVNHQLATEVLPLPKIGPRVNELLHARSALSGAGARARGGTA